MKKNTQPKVHVMDTIFRNKRILSFLVAAIVLLSTFPLGIIISNAATVADFEVTATDSVTSGSIAGATVTFKATTINGDIVIPFTDDNNDGVITVTGLEDTNTYTMDVSATGYVTSPSTTLDWAANNAHDIVVPLTKVSYDIAVKVTDIATAVFIGGATVTFKDNDSEVFTGTTDVNGAITVTGLNSDIKTYTMEVSATGYVTRPATAFVWTAVDITQPIVVELTKEPYGITTTVTGDVGGTITANPTSVPSGDSTNIIVAADTDYQIKSLTDNGNEVAGAAGETDLNYNLQVIEAHALVVTFVKLFDVNTSVTKNTGGTITNSSKVASGEKVTISVDANDGYQIKSLIDNGIDVKETTPGLSLQNLVLTITESHTIVVEFEQLFDIEAIVDSGHGKIEANPTSVPFDSSTTITVTAEPGSVIDKLTDSIDGNIEAAKNSPTYIYSIDKVDADHTINVKFVSARFTASVSNLNIGIVQDGGYTNGNVTISGYVYMEEVAQKDTTVTLSNKSTVTPTPAPSTDKTNEDGMYEFSENIVTEGTYSYVVQVHEDKKTISFKVDNTEPTINLPTKTPSLDISNKAVTISGTASDIGGSEISKIRYSNVSTDYAKDTFNTKASDATIDADWNAATKTYSFTIDYACNTTFYIWAYDNAGNKSAASIEKPEEPIQSIAVHIDKVAPTIDSIAKAPNSISTNQNVTISGKASDVPDVNTSGIAEVRYSNVAGDFDADQFSTPPSTASKATWDPNTGMYSFTIKNDCDMKYYVWAYDKAGNKSADKKEIAVLIDTIIPTVDSIVTTSVGVTNKDVTISGNASDNSSGIKEIRYSYTQSEYAKDTLLPDGMKGNTARATWNKDTGKYEFTVINECNTIYYVWAYDDAGNKSAASIKNPEEPIQSIPVHIDKTVPVISSITKLPATDWSAGAVTITVNGSDAVAGNGTDSASGIVKMFYGTTNDYSKAELIKDAVTAGSIYTITTPDSEFNGTYYFWALDAAGNVSELTKKSEMSVCIDKTKPFIKSLTFSVDGVAQDPSLIQISSYGYFFPKDTTVTISAQDDALSSGIKSITYYTVSEGIQSSEVTQNVVNNKITFDVKANFNGWIFAKATDMVGNVTDTFVKPTAGVIVEDAAKHLETSSISLVTPVTTNTDNTGLALYSGNVNVDVTVSDLYSGIDKIEWSIESAYDAKQSGTTNLYPQGAVTADTTGWTVTKTDNILITELTKTLTVSNNSNAIKVYVKLTDRAGNTSEKFITFSIDETAPTINLTYNNNSFDASFPGEYNLYKADRTATIVVTERNFSASDVISAITNTDGVIPAVSGWTESKNTLDPDKTTYTALISYSADGDYTFDIQFKDLADLQAAAFATDKFTIDKTLPIIQVSYDNTAAKNTNYFAKERTALITIKEHNFETGRIVITGTAADGTTATTFPAASSWTTSGDTHTASIRYADDALYTFDIAYVDKAGNATTDFPVQTFYIDKTAPAIAIKGIMDKSANKGDVIPVISLTDTNYNKDTVTVTLKGANKGSTVCNGSFASIAGGEKYTFANFEKTKAVDDIYTLTAKTIDRAGNETTSSITFSVNRFGSVYVFGETLKGITGKYVQRGMDVTITESNVDELEANKTKVRLTKNGEQIDLKEGTDYTVKHTGGNGGWSQYSYVLPAVLFTDDAKYVITLYSEDAAGNINENIAESKKSEIWFGVDKTLPVIIATDLVSGKTYALESKIVTADISDNLVLGSVKIFINDVETAVTEENGRYTFTIPGSNAAQQIKITAVDSAGNELVKEFQNVYVTTNLAVRWYTNTPLFIGSIVLVVLLVIALAYFLVFPKRRKTARR